MNIKQFKKRWLMSKIEPELFYMPAGKKEKEVKYVSISIRFIMSNKYDLGTKDFMPLTQEDISNYDYQNCSCGCVIKTSKEEIVYLRRSTYSYHYLRNIKCGKYSIKILLSNQAEIDNKWIDFEITEEDNNNTKIFVLSPQNNLFKTKSSLLSENKSDYLIFTSTSSDILEDNVNINNCEVYGNKKIEFYDKNNNLITTLDTTNSGFHCPLSFRGDVISPAYGGVGCNSLSLIVLMSERDVSKLSCSYDFNIEKRKSYNIYDDPLLASVQYTRYAAVYKTQYYNISEKLLPNTYSRNGYGILCSNNGSSRGLHLRESHNVTRVETYYSTLDLQISGKDNWDNEKEVYGKYMQVSKGYNQINGFFNSVFSWLKNYSTYYKNYQDKKTIDSGEHYFDGQWIVKSTTTFIPNTEKDEWTQSYDLKNFGVEDEALQYITKEEGRSYINGKEKLEVKCEIMYIASNLKFPFEFESLDIFNHASSLTNINASFYKDGNLFNAYDSCVYDKAPNNSVIKEMTRYELLGYTQISKDIEDYNNIPDIY